MTPLPPWMIIAVSLLTIYGLYKIYRVEKNWKIKMWMLIPFSFAFVYSWVWAFDPQIANVSYVVRNIIFFSFGVADFIIFDYSARLAGK